MQVIAFNGSARKNGNTAILLNAVLDALAEAGIVTDMVQLAGSRIRGCTACMECFTNQDRQCILKDDMTNECIEKMAAADGILLGSPTYFANVSTEMKALIDRAGMVARANHDLLARKVGAAVVAARRAGSIHVFNSINHFFLISQMIVPGSSYWNLGFGREKGEVEKDEEGLRTMRVLGRNMAWLLHKIRSEL